MKKRKSGSPARRKNNKKKRSGARKSNQLSCPGGGPRCNPEGKCTSGPFNSQAHLARHLSRERHDCLVSDCDKDFSTHDSMIRHVRSDHKEFDLTPHVRQQAPRISCPTELAEFAAGYPTVVMMIKTHVKNDLAKERTNAYTVELSKSNEAVHALAQTILHQWREQSPERYDQIGGSLPLDLTPHADNLMSMDRVDDALPHFVALATPFANIRLVPLKLNTRFSLLKLFHPDEFRPEMRAMVARDRHIAVDVEAQIVKYQALPKTMKNLIYRLYQSCKERNKKRHARISAPLPKDPPFEECQAQLFKLLRAQKGKDVNSDLCLNWNYDGVKQLQMSVDRIDPANINYWDWSNLQLVCVALNVSDCKNQKTYVAEGDGELGGAITREWFMRYFGLEL